ncbi:hypothetical protein MXB_3660 [Myxobolus squamalis]|nr:hypothetical protein MXB_3660 [Myxobolus squamalis]
MSAPNFQPTPDNSFIYQFAYPGYSLFFEDVGSGESYCFILFSHPSVASAALNILNGRTAFDKKLRVNWACPPTAPRQITFTESDGYAIYVGDLGADIDDKTLYEAFQTFGEVRYDLCMGHGLYAILTQGCQRATALLCLQLDDLSCRQFFEPYGMLQECKYFPDKRYAFIRFDTHEAAATAIVRCNGQMVDGSMIKCWWSKDNSATDIVGSTTLVPTQTHPSAPYGGNPHPNYPPNY